VTAKPPTPRTDPAPLAAHRSAAWRTLLVCLLWIATWPLRPYGPPARLALDALLALAGWWAVHPGRRQGGPLFGEDGHWTSVLIALPIGFAIAALAELWHMLRGTPG
jgi:hypothetical protein